MFEPGQLLFYPFHGPGCIARKKTIRREDGVERYFVVTFFMKDLQILVPADFKPERCRRLISEREFVGRLRAMREEILNQDYGRGEIQKVPRNRLEGMEAKIKQEGDPGEMMEALQRLHARFLERTMNLGEKRVYDLAREYSTGELMGTGGYDRTEAERRMFEFLPGVIPRLEREKQRGRAS